jgi:hypothetical protein
VPFEDMEMADAGRAYDKEHSPQDGLLVPTTQATRARFGAMPRGKTVLSDATG